MQHVVLIIVIIVSIWAHVWMLLFMRFKIDEGCILRYLNDHFTQNEVCEVSAVSQAISLSTARVAKASIKSKAIEFIDGKIKRIN